MHTLNRILTLALLALCAVAPASAESRVSKHGTAPATSSRSGDEVLQIARQVTAATNTKFIRNRGFGSMRPVFDTNSILLVEEPRYETLRVGDIVIFESDGKLVSHRIIEKRGDKYWTQGDNNRRPDSLYVTRSNLRYRVWGVLYSDNYNLGLSGPGASADASPDASDDSRDLGAL
jgi:hypothetical protein